jgi:hypothetical protein
VALFQQIIPDKEIDKFSFGISILYEPSTLLQIIKKIVHFTLIQRFCEVPKKKQQAQSIFFESVSESHSVVCDCLRLHELYSSWNSPGQNTGVGSLSLIQGMFPTQDRSKLV